MTPTLNQFQDLRNSPRTVAGMDNQQALLFPPIHDLLLYSEGW
jgi:hypothetical protein